MQEASDHSDHVTFDASEEFADRANRDALNTIMTVFHNPLCSVLGHTTFPVLIKGTRTAPELGSKLADDAAAIRNLEHL